MSDLAGMDLPMYMYTEFSEVIGYLVMNVGELTSLYIDPRDAIALVKIDIGCASYLFPSLISFQPRLKYRRNTNRKARNNSSASECAML